MVVEVLLVSVKVTLPDTPSRSLTISLYDVLLAGPSSFLHPPATSNVTVKNIVNMPNNFLFEIFIFLDIDVFPLLADQL